MPVERAEFVQERYRDSPEYREVTGIADRRRLKKFFAPRNYTNVRGLFVFGY